MLQTVIMINVASKKLLLYGGIAITGLGLAGLYYSGGEARQRRSTKAEIEEYFKRIQQKNDKS